MCTSSLPALTKSLFPPPLPPSLSPPPFTNLSQLASNLTTFGTCRNPTTHPRSSQRLPKLASAKSIFSSVSDASRGSNYARRMSRKMSRKRYAQKESLFKLSRAERAFLPLEVKKRLGQAAGQLPPAPCMFNSHGAVMFVDVSGFTLLGETLRAKFSPQVAAGKVWCLFIGFVLLYSFHTYPFHLLLPALSSLPFRLSMCVFETTFVGVLTCLHSTTPSFPPSPF